MAEQPRHERRDADVLRHAGRHHADEARTGNLGNLELLELEQAVEDFLGIERQKVDGAAVDLDATVLDRLHPVVIAAGDGDGKGGHCVLSLSAVMPGPVPGIHVLLPRIKTWMAGTSPAMTSSYVV